MCVIVCQASHLARWLLYCHPCLHLPIGSGQDQTVWRALRLRGFRQNKSTFWNRLGLFGGFRVPFARCPSACGEEVKWGFVFAIFFSPSPSPSSFLDSELLTRYSCTGCRRWHPKKWGVSFLPTQGTVWETCLSGHVQPAFEKTVSSWIKTAMPWDSPL